MKNVQEPRAFGQRKNAIRKIRKEEPMQTTNDTKGKKTLRIILYYDNT